MGIKKYPYSRLRKPGQGKIIFFEIKERLADQD
jgi:hypothetical protein